MGLWQRKYMKGAGSGGNGASVVGFGMPRPTRAVKILLLLNAAMFALQLFFDRGTIDGVGWMSRWLGVTGDAFWQPWRYLTSQFLHADGWHIAMNMLGLYILGTPLEGLWGARRFTVFYLACGAAAGVAYVIIGKFASLPGSIPIIGASGGVYAVVLACAVFFPHFQIIFLFFPVMIRLASIIIFGIMIFSVLQALASGHAAAAMSDVAHLGGAAAAAVWIWGVPRIRGGLGGSLTGRLRQGAWKRKIQHQADLQTEVDRILLKIRQEGIASLTGKEKRTLQEATRLQRERDRV